MAIRSLIIKIGGDTANLEKALASVGETTKNLDAGLKKLGQTPIGKQAQQDAERLQKTLDAVRASTQRLADTGLNAARGIEAIGGPARLTSSQLGEMNRTIQNSLDAFRALGQEAPAELRKVAAAIQAQQKVLQTPLAPPKQQGGLLSSLLPSLPGGGLLSEFGAGGVAAGIAASATAGAAALGLAAKQAIDYADALTKMSDRTGIGVVALQRLEAIATASGNSLEEITSGVNQFQKRLASGDIDKPIRDLGLSFENLRRSSPDDQFIQIANAIQKVKDPAEQTRLAMELFGKSGAQLLPTLKANVDELADSTFKMSAESVKALDDFGDSIGRAKTSALNFLGELAGKTITVTLNVVRTVTDVVPQKRDFTIDQGLRDQLELLQKFPALLKDAAASIKDVKVGSDLLPKIDPAAATAFTNSLLGTVEAQEKAAAAAAKLKAQLEAIDDKIREATAPIVQLTDAQKNLVLQFDAFGLSNQEIALKLGVSTNSVKAFLAELDGVGAAFAANAESSRRAQTEIGKLDLGYLKARDSVTVLRKATLALTEAQAAQFDGRDFLAATDPIDKFSKHLLKLQDITDRNSGTMRTFRNELEKDAKQAKTADEAVDGLVRALADLAQIGGSGFGGIVQGLSRIVAGANAAKKALDTLKNPGKGFEGIINRISGGLSLGVAVFDIGKTIFDAFHKSEAEKIANDVGRDLGVRISDALADSIKVDEKKLRDAFAERNGITGNAKNFIDPKQFRGAATALNLDKIIQEGGGVESFGFDLAVKRARDLFSILEDGQVTVQQVGATFDRVFSQLVPNAISKSSGLASENFVELQQVAINKKVQGPALDQFRGGQVNNILGGVNRSLSPANDAIAKQADAQKRLADLQSQLADASATEQARIRQEIAKTTDEINKQGQIIQATQIGSQGAATGFAGALLGAFGELQRQGTPILDIFKQMQPAIDGFAAQLDRTGFSGGAAFDKIRNLAALAKDEVAGPALDSISGLQGALSGLANIGALDKDTFAGLTSQVGSTFKSLVDQGKDGNDILKLMQPTLQTIFELQQRTGFQVDETTQNLLSQAQAQGLVGDQFKSTGQQTVDILGRIDTVLEAVAKAFGVTLPDAADKGAKGIDGALDKVDTTKLDDITPKIDPAEVARLRELMGGNTGIAGGVDGLKVKLDQLDVNGALDPKAAEDLKRFLDEAAAASGNTAGSLGQIGTTFRDDLPKATQPFETALDGVFGQLSQQMPSSARSGVGGVNDALRDINTDITVHISFQVDPVPPLGVNGETAGATGGRITPTGIQPLAGGGRVLAFPSVYRAQGGPIAQTWNNNSTSAIYRAGGGTLVNFVPRQTDTVPALLPPDYLVLNAPQQHRVLNALQTIMQSPTTTIGGDTFTVSNTHSLTHPILASVPATDRRVPVMLTPKEQVVPPAAQARLDRVFAKAGLPSLVQIAFGKAPTPRAQGPVSGSASFADGGRVGASLFIASPVSHATSFAHHHVAHAGSVQSSIWNTTASTQTALYRAQGGPVTSWQVVTAPSPAQPLVEGGRVLPFLASGGAVTLRAVEPRMDTSHAAVPSSGGDTWNVSIHAVDAPSFEDLVRRRGVKVVVQEVLRDKRGSGSMLKRKLSAEKKAS